MTPTQWTSCAVEGSLSAGSTRSLKRNFQDSLGLALLKAPRTPHAKSGKGTSSTRADQGPEKRTGLQPLRFARVGRTLLSLALDLAFGTRWNGAGGPPFRVLPSRSGTVGAPSLRSLQGRVRCCRYHGVCHAHRTASSDRTRSWNSLDRDASAEAAHGPRSVAQAQTEQSAPTQSAWRRAATQSVLAGVASTTSTHGPQRSVAEKLRYMHRNPVKRGLVEAPEQWCWSSYRFYLLEEVGSVRVNEGWPAISFRDRLA